MNFINIGASLSFLGCSGSILNILKPHLYGFHLIQ